MKPVFSALALVLSTAACGSPATESAPAPPPTLAVPQAAAPLRPWYAAPNPIHVPDDSFEQWWFARPNEWYGCGTPQTYERSALGYYY